MYETDYPATAACWQVSRNGEHRPFWSADGRTLYFHAGDSFTVDAPLAVTTLGDHIAGFALSKSGRFLILRELDAGTSLTTEVLSWQRLLEK